jgi:quercetin dioxygenase-like cupin family protein
MKDTQTFRAGPYEFFLNRRDENTPSPSAEEVEAKLHLEGYESFQWYDVPGAKYPRHKHEYDECLWIIKGELLITFENQSLTLKNGDRIYLPAQIPHQLKVSAQASATYVVGQKNKSKV